MKVGGQILWNVTPICETSQIYYLMERRPEKTFWATIQRTDYSIWFIGWVSPYNCERSVPNPSIWKESFTWIFPRIRSLRGGNLEGWRTDRRPWGVGDDGRIGNLLEKTQCERGDISKKKGEFIFPVSDGRIKLSGGDQELRTSTLVRHRPIQGESNIDFLGESEGSLPQPHDSFPDAGEAINDFWSMSGSFIYRHHVEPRVHLYSPREESFPIPLTYIDASRTTQTNLDVMQESRIDDYWNIDGSRDLSDSFLDRFHSVYSVRWETSRRVCVVQEKSDKMASDFQARSFMARTLVEIWEELPSWRRSINGPIEKT